MNLSEYILKSRDERRAHIDLTCECVLVKRTNWSNKKADHLNFFEVEDDVDVWRGSIGRLHACAKDTFNGEMVCINPLHIYIGTITENLADRPTEKAGAGGRALRGKERSESFKAKNKARLNKPVVATHLQTGTKSHFESSKIASETLSVSRAAISGALKHNRPTCGYTFHYMGK